MTAPSKTILSRFFLGTLVATMFVAPGTVSATRGGVAAVTKGECDRIQAVAAEVNSKITLYSSELEAERAARLHKIAVRRSNRDEWIKLQHVLHDARHRVYFAKLEKGAATGREKQAVTAFESTVSAAIAARRAAVDAASKDFRDGIDQLIASREAFINSARDAYEEAVRRATSLAQSDCDEGVSVKTVRKAFREAMKVAQKKFRDQVREVESQGGISTGALATAHSHALQNATAGFQDVVTKAEADLKEVLRGHQ